jgi:allophanate hydrolase
LRQECYKTFDQADVLVTPTIPTIPRRSEVHTDSVGWSRRLGYYTNFANLLGLAALSLPTGFTARGLPGGATVFAPAGSEQRLCEWGMNWQRWFQLPLGATRERLPLDDGATAPELPRPPAPGQVRVAVAGAHLRGQPLHRALLQTGARFVRGCRTAARYRFLALLDLQPPRPGLLRDDARAGAVAVEVYDLPLAGFGALVASVAPPLAIGTIELEDGEAVKGFLCESFAAAQARDITEFDGWTAFREHAVSSPGFRSRS